MLPMITSPGDLGGEVLALPLGPFNSWDCGVACWRFLTQVLLWHTWRGRWPLSLASLKTGLGKQWRDTLATTYPSARNTFSALEQDIPSDAPEIFIAR